MISITEALAIIEQHTVDLGVEQIPLAQSLGRVLKETWVTDRDLPPYDRITMDGIGIQYAQFASGTRCFPIQGIAAAGMSQQTLKNNTHCLEVMTGSILPNNCDTVIRYEDLQIEKGIAKVLVDEIANKQNVHFKGEDRKVGEIIVHQNTRISPAEIGVGASVGKAMVQVARLPKVIVISTGDELVKIDSKPLPHQIRRSNVYRLVATLQSLNIAAENDHLNDEPEEIKDKLSIYLEQFDAIILSGGVSKGKFDYLPRILEELGVTKHFHRVKQKPGKPFWFGKYKDQCTIFALPGNPVSSFMCMQRYFLHWLSLSQIGRTPPTPYAILTAPVHFKPDLTYFLEVKISYSEQGQILAQPIKGNGSGDLANLVDADAFIQLPSSKATFEAGEIYPVYFYR